MAKETAKNNWRRNEARMKVFTFITMAVNLLYTGLIIYHRGGLPSIYDLIAIAFWAGQEYATLQLLKGFAMPSFDVSGELLSCPDASNPKELGYYSFVQDLLWICWTVQTLCNVHTAFFVFYLPVPATLIYKGWTIARPFLTNRMGMKAANGAMEGGEQPPRNRQERRREELERRKNRRS
ncbi:unnamed protein product [Phytomonas sp. Hart1]|nr:unnamed protein product [Phytomonas sp. Hart1]|eukprot:CCW71304.1 unnamed protein product [Phytomonas sp. isolate Hart1]